MEKIAVQRGFANTPKGQIHYAMAGQGKPVLLLHQTPRSWDEYRDVLPIIGEKCWAIAMDAIDALKVGERVEEGHQAVSRYKMEGKVPLIKAPTLVLGGGRGSILVPQDETPLR